MSGRRVALLFSRRGISGRGNASTRNIYYSAQCSVAAAMPGAALTPRVMIWPQQEPLSQYRGVRWYCTSPGNLPPHSLVTLPALSPTMETGTIVKWDKEVGDTLEEGDIIAQVETDKAVMDMETPSEGYLAKIIIPAGTKEIPLGKLLAIIVDDKSSIDSFNDYQPPSATDSPPPPVQETTETPALSTTPTPATTPTPSTAPPHSLVTLPALSPTMETGTIVKWDKEVGDTLEEGDIIAQVETDKAVMDMETPSEGYLAKIIVPAGTKEIPLGKLLAIIVDDKSNIDSFNDYQPPSTTDSPPPPVQETTAETPAPSTTPTPVTTPTPSTTSSSPGPTGRIIASPYAKTIARERGVNLQGVQGTGPLGRIVANDVLSTQQDTAITHAPPGAAAYEDIPLSGMRKTIAKRLVQSKQTVPHYYLSVDVNMAEVSKARSQINTTLKDLKLSYNDFIIKASALALKEIPQVNSQWMDSFIRKYNTVDISVAVSTEGGLITPIVTNADVKGLSSINSEVKSLAERARLGQLQPHEFQGGTFTISNLGMYGIKNFTAVINPPQSCILAVGKTEKRVIVEDGDKLTAADVMSVTMSCDHRVVDGAVGAQWLAVFKSYLESPYRMLL